MYYYIPHQPIMDILYKTNEYTYYSLNSEDRVISHRQGTNPATAQFEMGIRLTYRANTIITESKEKMSLDTKSGHYNDYIRLLKSRRFGSDMKWTRDDWDLESSQYIHNTINILNNTIALPYSIFNQVDHDSFSRALNRLTLTNLKLDVISNYNPYPPKSFDLGQFTPLNFGTFLLLSEMRLNSAESWISVNIDDIFHLPEQECPIVNNAIDTVRKLIWILNNA